MSDEYVTVPFDKNDSNINNLIGQKLLLNQAIFRVYSKANTIVTDDPTPNGYKNTYYWCELESPTAFIGHMELKKGSRIILQEFVVQKFLINQALKDVV